MILLHQVQRHRVGDGDVEIVGIAIDVAAHHPPGEFDGLAEGILELATPGRIHYLKNRSVCVGEGILQVMRVPGIDIDGGDGVPDCGVGAHDQIDRSRRRSGLTGKAKGEGHTKDKKAFKWMSLQ